MSVLRGKTEARLVYARSSVILDCNTELVAILDLPIEAAELSSLTCIHQSLPLKLQRAKGKLTPILIDVNTSQMRIPPALLNTRKRKLITRIAKLPEL